MNDLNVAILCCAVEVGILRTQTMRPQDDSALCVGVTTRPYPEKSWLRSILL
jgi:hypothetical protein